MLRDDWLPATFSKVVHRRREFLRISQEELSHRSGLHRTYISDVERGARNVSLKNMSKLAAALEISPSALIRWTEIRNFKELSTAIEPELADFLDSIGKGYLLLDSAGAVLDANATQMAFLNRGIESLVGARVFELFSDDDRQKLAVALEAVRLEGVAQRVRAHFVPSTGAPIAVSLDLAPIKDEANEFTMTRISSSVLESSADVDASPRNALEKPAAGSYLLELQLGVVSALEESESFSAASQRILEALATDRWDFAMLWWVDPDGGQLRPFSSVCAEGMPPDAVANLTEGIRFLNYGLPRIVWESRQSFWIEDVATETRCRPQVTENALGLRSGVWFPITVGREVIGVFEMLSKRTIHQDADVLECFTTLGARIGRSILRSGERPRIGEATSQTVTTKKFRQ